MTRDDIWLILCSGLIGFIVGDALAETSLAWYWVFPIILISTPVLTHGLSVIVGAVEKRYERR